LKNLPSLLTFPGNGVFTVHTAREKKEKLAQAYYKTTVDKAETKWKSSLSKIKADRPIILGIPSDNGGGIQRGANWGPLAVREELLEDKDLFHDIGDVRVIPHLLHDKYLNLATIKECQRALYGKVNKLPVSPLSIAETAASEIFQTLPDARIFGIGGDHSTSYPLVKAWLKSRKHKKKCALLHFDAHTDLLELRLGIDLCFGTWTFQILDELTSPDHVLQLGIRSSGKTKKHWKSKMGVEQFWSSEIKVWGVEKTFKKISSHFDHLGIEELYISFDIDALDMKYASATGTPEPGGLSPSDCAALIQLVSQKYRITGADLMEVAPFVCPDGVTLSDRSASLSVAGDIARVLLESMQR
jgi:agmatinase